MEVIKQEDEEIPFTSEDLERISLESIEGVLKEAVFDDRKVDQWINEICEETMRKLSESTKPYKYIITCTITQKTNAGLHVTSSLLWENSLDSIHITKQP